MELSYVSRQMIAQSPELLDDIRREATRIISLCGYAKRLFSLKKIPEWEQFNWSVMIRWANAVDEPFVKLMQSLSKHHYHYNAISMHRWWERLKACNQHHVISYFTYVNFVEPGVIGWEQVYSQSCRTRGIFEQMLAVYNDDRAIEMNVRALIGCSQEADLHSAWVKWAKNNHPDKGGSVEQFILVKSAYEEYERCKHSSTE